MRRLDTPTAAPSDGRRRREQAAAPRVRQRADAQLIVDGLHALDAASYLRRALDLGRLRTFPVRLTLPTRVSIFMPSTPRCAEPKTR